MMLNPTTNCGCCGAGRVLVWIEKIMYPYGFADLAGLYQQTTPQFNTDIFFTVSQLGKTGLSPYSFILIPMPLACSIQSLLGPWLNTGKKRLAVTGEFGSYWDACSIFANGIVSALGVPMSTSTGVIYEYGDCQIPIPTQISSSLKVGKNNATMSTADSGTVTGGTPIITAVSTWVGFDPGTLNPGTTEGQSFVPAAVAPFGNKGSEVILTGDVNIFTGCPLVLQNNKQFLTNCAGNF